MRRIRSSLSAKVFLWMLLALTLCGLAVYGIVMAVIPRQYVVLSDSRIAQQIDRLAAELDGLDLEAASAQIYDFCIQNHAAAVLTTGDQSVAFGDADGLSDADSAASVSIALQLSDVRGGSMLSIVSSASTAREIARTFWQILPLVIALILAISSLSAWFCSRLVVRPVLRISGVSRRMAQMDMTWHCDEGRSDELGVLAESLNTLSERLARAMGELEAANAQLREDIADARALEKQRRDFFAAASHELKTPIAILRGQLESMALGIGDYKNHAKYLPQSLATVERIEALVKEILAISRMESGVPRSSFADTPLAPVLRECIAEIEPLAGERGIVLDASQIDEGVCASVNAPLFRKALSNILSNAVRYTPPGQRVAIALTREALTVENAGVTLAEEDLQSLFRPFYRVDKSRNRNSGGSGLGLYIVKTILDLHDLGYEIANGADSVRFTIHLKP